MAKSFVRAAAVFCSFFALVTFPASRAGGGLVSVGVMGDSLSDEYQFADDPPDRQAARNYVEILAGAGRLDFGPFD